MKTRLPTRIEIGHLWVMAIVIGVFAFVNTHPIRPHDFWWHLAAGREIAASGTIPLADEYSYTAEGRPYPAYAMFWLADIAFYEVYRLGGPQLVVFSFSLIITAAYSMLLWICYRESGSLRVAAGATLLAIIAGFDSWNVRPQGISYLLGVLFLWAIYGYRRRPHPAWLAVFPLAMLAWANTHGSFPIGLVLLGIWLADEAWSWLRATWRGEPNRSARRLLAPATALLLAGLACLANPRGSGIFGYVAALSGNPVVRSLVAEWAPPTLDARAGTLFIIVFLLGTLILIFSPRRLNPFQLLTLLIFSLLAFKTLRGAVWFGLAMAPVYADHLAAIATGAGLQAGTGRPRPGRPVFNLIFLGVLLAMALLSLPWMRRILPLPGAKSEIVSIETPVAATEYLLSTHPAGQIFHEMGFGSYLIWAAQPDYPVFADPRIELYPRSVWNDYMHISNALPGWEGLLKRYGVGTLMLSPSTQGELIAAVQASVDWWEIYRDDVAVIYTRR